MYMINKYSEEDASREVILCTHFIFLK